MREQDAWLRGHLAKVEPRIRVGQGTVVPFRDGRLTIAPGAKLAQHGDVLTVPGPPDHAGVMVARFLCDTARDVCTDAARIKAAGLGRSVRRISLRDTRSRWGSCSAAGDLMFSWRLVMAPVSVLDYVIAHEVAHLTELNHSDRFWAQVRMLCPDLDAARHWLRRHGADLHAYDFSAAAPGG